MRFERMDMDEMTLLDAARAGELTPEMEQAAKYDGLEPEEMRRRLAAGSRMPCLTRKEGSPLVIENIS